ncbi:MAG: hypothetical protein CL450_09020 [Acidimicrobiaceae bacterium]|nr:hypothetical protein [Acidimicrobiaceae bacterium]
MRLAALKGVLGTVVLPVVPVVVPVVHVEIPVVVPVVPAEGILPVVVVLGVVLRGCSAPRRAPSFAPTFFVSLFRWYTPCPALTECQFQICVVHRNPKWHLLLS